jgi:hypothetical protein
MYGTILEVRQAVSSVGRSFGRCYRRCLSGETKSSMELFRRLYKLFPVWREALAGATGDASQVKTKSRELFRSLDKLFPVWAEALAGATGGASQVRRKVGNFSEQ